MTRMLGCFGRWVNIRPGGRVNRFAIKSARMREKQMWRRAA